MADSSSPPMNRRSFLKLGAGVAGVAVMADLKALGVDTSALRARALSAPLKQGKEVPSICPYCAVGCGQIVTVDAGAGKIIDIRATPIRPSTRARSAPRARPRTNST